MKLIPVRLRASDPHALTRRAADVGNCDPAIRLRLPPVREVLARSGLAYIDVTGAFTDGVAIDARDGLPFVGPDTRCIGLVVHGRGPPSKQETPRR